jgi:hypothetical protein
MDVCDGGDTTDEWTLQCLLLVYGGGGGAMTPCQAVGAKNALAAFPRIICPCQALGLDSMPFRVLKAIVRLQEASERQSQRELERILAAARGGRL